MARRDGVQVSWVREMVPSRDGDLLRAPCPGDMLPLWGNRDGATRVRNGGLGMPALPPPRIVQAAWVVIVAMATATLVISMATAIVEMWP